MLATIILAAGKGKRMDSDLPKVLHPLSGKPLIEYVLSAADYLHPDETIIVIGHKREQVQERLIGRTVQFVVQDPPKGTGHAVMQAESALYGKLGDVVVLSGDVPLLRGETLARLLQIHQQNQNAASVLSTVLPNPTGYGRIVRDTDGAFQAIIEEKEASSDIKKINEINSGIYAFNIQELFEYLKHVQPDNRKGEYYLTDVIGLMVEAGKRVEAHAIADFREVRGINTQQELKDAENEYSSHSESPKKC